MTPIKDSTETASRSRQETAASKTQRKGKRGRTTRPSPTRAGSSRKDSSKAFDLADQFRREVAHMAEVETGFAKACRKLLKTVGHPELQHAIEELQERSESYGRSLQRVIEEHGVARATSTPDGLPRLLLKGLSGQTPAEGGEVLITTQLQKFLHYSIASYGSLAAWSREMRDRDGAILFERLTEERKRADEDLSELAYDLLESQGAGSGPRRT